MTLTSTTARVSYPGTGTVGPFTVPFRFLDEDELFVTKLVDATFAETELTLTTHYTVSGEGNTSGAITLVTALAVGETIVIRRHRDLTQETSLRNQGAYFGATHEDQFDRFAMQDQQQQDEIDRSFKLSETIAPAAYNTKVRPETGKVLGWGAGGLENKTIDLTGIALPGAGRTVATTSAYLANNAFFNPKDFGATGDGVTNDRAAIIACDIAAAAAGHSVFLFPGTYVISQSYTLTANWVRLPGAKFKLAADAQLTFTLQKTFEAAPDQCFEHTAGTAWADATVYTIGDIRSVEGLNYRCVANHTSAEATDKPGTGITGDRYTWYLKWAVYGPVKFTDTQSHRVWPEWFGAKASSNAAHATTNVNAFKQAYYALRQGFGVGTLELGCGRYHFDTSVAGPIIVPANTATRGVATRFGGTRIRQGGDRLFFLAGADEGGSAFETTLMEGLCWDGGGAAGTAKGIIVRRAWTQLKHIEFEAFVGHTCIELDDAPTGLASGNPFNSTLEHIYIRCWGGTHATPGTIRFGIRAIRNFNASCIQFYTVTGALKAGISIERGSNYKVTSGNCEDCYDLDGGGATTDVTVGILIGGDEDGLGSIVNTAGKLDTCYGEKIDGAAIKVVKVTGLTIDNCYSDGLTGSSDHDGQRGIWIVDATGTGGDVKGLKIMGGAYQRHAAADLSITGTKKVERDGVQLLSSTNVVLGAGGGYRRRDPLEISLDDEAKTTLLASDLGATVGVVISITTGDADVWARVFLRGASDAQILEQQGSPAFSATEDNAGTLNIYRDSDGLYYIQNKTGGGVGVVIEVMHFHNK